MLTMWARRACAAWRRARCCRWCRPLRPRSPTPPASVATSTPAPTIGSTSSSNSSVHLSDYLAVVRGGGELGTAAAHRLARAGFTVIVTELAQPLALRRGAAFAEAVYA